MAALARLAGRGAGAAVVAPGPIDDARWRLVVVADGFARLEPLGLDMRAAGMETIESSIASLDEEAIAGAASLLSVASVDEDVAPLVELGAEAPRRPQRRRPEVWVDVLGPVEVSGWAEPIGRHRKLEELVVYLATHAERPVSGERVRCAVWAESEVGAKTFVQAVSRARRCLGGQAYLPPASAGVYCLGPEKVGCIWPLFKELAAAATAASRSNPSESMALWSEALGLVRGEPFAGVAKGTYVWAWSEQLVYEMQVAITRAADALGAMALAQDDPDTALWATRQGLLAMPEHAVAVRLGDAGGRPSPRPRRAELGLPCPAPSRTGPGPPGRGAGRDRRALRDAAGRAAGPTPLWRQVPGQVGPPLSVESG